MGLKQLVKRLVPRSLVDSLSDGARYVHDLETNLFLSLPNATKRAFVANAARKLGYPTFIETGTFEGDMALAASRDFSRVHTIELDPALAGRATERLSSIRHIEVHQGNSGEVLSEILASIDTSCVFWLDAHYSGGSTARGKVDTPLLDELAAIKSHPVRPHAILIDDARVLGTDDAYPSLDEVINLLREIDPQLRIGVSSDILWAAKVKLLDFQWREASDGRVSQPTSAHS